MFERIMPIFAVIGILSSTAYLSLALWMLYENFSKKEKSRHHPKSAEC